MNKLWMSVSITIMTAVFFALPGVSDAQKGKGGGGGGKGGGGGGKGGSVLPSGPSKGEPSRPVDHHPNSGNQHDTRDKLPKGPRDIHDEHSDREHHPNQDRKTPTDAKKHEHEQRPAQGQDRQEQDQRRTSQGQDRNASRPFAHPNSGNSLPQDIKDKLPPGLRDMPENHPGLANHLRKMGVLKDYPKIDPVPPELRSKMPEGLRNQPYDNPAVANFLGRNGWSIGEDGALIPPLGSGAGTPGSMLSQLGGGSPLSPLGGAPGAAGAPGTQQPFQPLGGFFRRR